MTLTDAVAASPLFSWPRRKLVNSRYQTPLPKRHSSGVLFLWFFPGHWRHMSWLVNFEIILHPLKKKMKLSDQFSTTVRLVTNAVPFAGFSIIGKSRRGVFPWVTVPQNVSCF